MPGMSSITSCQISQRSSVVGGIGELSDSTLRHIDTAAGLVAFGSIFNALPKIAALFTIIWLGVRIWESDTVRGLTGRTLTGKRDAD
jgi:hypothetical protein